MIEKWKAVLHLGTWYVCEDTGDSQSPSRVWVTCGGDEALARRAVKLPELEATAADLLKALAGLVEIDGCDGRGDPARTVMDDLREQAWANAYAAIAKAKGEDLPP